MQMTLPEVLLIGLLLLTAFSLFRCLDKPGILNVVILAVCLVYMYFVHMRTMGFFVAACITLVADCCGDKRKRKLLLFFFMTIILLFLAGYMVKNALTNDAYRYASEAVLAVNDYSGQVEKIKGLLNAEGLERLLISVMGKLFYLGCASLGLFFQGMWFLWKKTKKYCFALSRHNVAAEEGVCFYLFAGILFQVGISAIFTVSCERIDYILYGRYNEIFLPIVIALGMTEFMVSHRVFRSWLVYAAVQGAAAFCLAVFIGSREITQVYGYFITGISYALDGSGFGGPRTIWAAYAVSCAVAMAAWLIIGFWEKKGNGKAYYAAAGMLAAVWIGTALWAASLYIYPHNMENREDIRLCEQLSWLNEEGRKLCFLNSPGVTYVDLLQYMLRDISIQVLDGENCMKELTSDMAVLIYRDNQEVAALSEVYNVRVETSHFILLYNS